MLGITFNIKDLKLCEYLQSKLGGKIRLKTKYNACDFMFYSRPDLINIVQLMHNKLRSPKISKFNALIDYINEKPNLNIKPAIIDESDLSSNSWLAGFIDADDSFQIKYTVGKKLQMGCSLNIE
jgi:hypothetical protein